MVFRAEWKAKEVKFTLEQAMKALRGVTVFIYFFFNLGDRCGWVVNATPRPLYFREIRPVPIVVEAEWDLVSVWTGA